MREYENSWLLENVDFSVFETFKNRPLEIDDHVVLVLVKDGLRVWFEFHLKEIVSRCPISVYNEYVF